tara:strand:+ start:826 stop:1056 length:231 start_codon:yes stop_codon:yes gene_type:complete
MTLAAGTKRMRIKSSLAGSAELHPLLQHHLWLPSRIPVEDGFPEVLSADNDVVWNVMMPSLLLATLMLQNAYMVVW